MWHRRRGGFFSFGFGFPPFFYFRGPRHFPKLDEYIKMLEEYRDELKKELEQEELTQVLREGYQARRAEDKDWGSGRVR